MPLLSLKDRGVVRLGAVSVNSQSADAAGCGGWVTQRLRTHNIDVRSRIQDESKAGSVVSRPG